MTSARQPAASKTPLTRGTPMSLGGCESSGTPTPAVPAEIVLLVLDSTVLIDYLRGRPVVARVRSLRSSGDVPATTAVNVEEVVRGLGPTEVHLARRLFRGLVVLEIDQAVGWRAGLWRQAFAVSGTTLAQADCLIAAAAVHHQGVLCTGNPTDFPMADLTVQHWVVGE